MTGTSTRDPLVGHVLEGRYEIIARLARGGMATVYRAHDRRLTRMVAIKVMHDGLGDDAEFSRKFDREARAAAVVSNPHVVSVFDQGRDGHRPYIVMEYVEGWTLRHVITREAPLDPLRALDLLEPVASALASAHEAGIVHRDVKPENVLISARGQVKVTDFGLARAISSQTATATQGMLMGTVSYLPPELVTVGRTDSRGDVYSAGVMLFEMLTGRKPHTGDVPIQVAYMHVHSDIPAPSTVVGSVEGLRPIPQYLDALVQACTRRTPAERPCDARELLHLLRTARRAMASGITDDPGLTRMMWSSVSRGAALRPTPPTRPSSAHLSRDSTRTSAPRTPDSTAPATAHGTAAPGGIPAGRTPSFHDQVVPGQAPRDRASHRQTQQNQASPTPAHLTATSPARVTRPRSTQSQASGNPPRPVRAPQAREDSATRRPASMPPPEPGSVPVSPARASRGSYALRPRGNRMLDVHHRRRRMASLLVLLVLVLLLVMGVKACAAEQRVSEPTLTNLPQAQAVQALDANGLQAAVEREYSDTIAPGRVTRTDPDAGTRLARDTQVTVWVSRGVEHDTVPTLVGRSRESATRALTGVHLAAGRISTTWSRTVPAGVVMQASSPAGAVLRHGSRVDLTVSGGPRPVALGSLTGTPADRDAAALRAQGLTVVTRQQNSDTVPQGQVVSQAPAAGTVHEGDTVTLVVSEGPEQVAVPDTLLRNEADARAALTAAGFQVKVSYATPSWLRLDKVASESPTGTATKGSTITIWVG